jgi:hypothetical protein
VQQAPPGQLVRMPLAVFEFEYIGTGHSRRAPGNQSFQCCGALLGVPCR